MVVIKNHNEAGMPDMNYFQITPKKKGVVTRPYPQLLMDINEGCGLLQNSSIKQVE
jgi:hypothetical protein